MKAPDLVVAPAGSNAPSLLGPPTNEAVERAPANPTTVRRLGLARALQLGHVLGVHVIVDHTGWLSRGVEIVYRCERGSTIHPITVRVGRDARDEDVLADGGALGICRKYNEALDKLRQLAIRLAAVIRECQIVVAAGSPLETAQLELSSLDGLIVSRQMKHMAGGVVRLDRLRTEIDFFEGRRACFIPIVIAAEQDAHPSWAADTQEFVRDE